MRHHDLIYQQLFAERIGNLSYEISTSKLPLAVMSADKIQEALDLEYYEDAQFIEDLGFYNDSFITYGYPTKAVTDLQVIVHHQSTEHQKKCKKTYASTGVDTYDDEY